MIDALRRDSSEHHEHAGVVADFLDEMRERMALLIPETDADPYAETRDDRLTVLTMAGLTLPKDGVPREYWTDAESLGVEMLNLAAWLTQRSVYEKPKEMRKGVWIDEAFFLSEVPTGRVLMNRFARDSRKWNVRVLLSSQIPADFLKIQGFVTLLDSVFVGRLDDDDAQADALRLLKVPVGVGYEQVVAALGRRPGRAAARPGARRRAPPVHLRRRRGRRGAHPRRLLRPAPGPPAGGHGHDPGFEGRGTLAAPGQRAGAACGGEEAVRRGPAGGRHRAGTGLRAGGGTGGRPGRREPPRRPGPTGLRNRRSGGRRLHRTATTHRRGKGGTGRDAA